MRWVRKCYDWVLSWAQTPYGSPALFGLAFAEASFFPIPPDPLLMALSLSRTERSWRYAVLCTAGSVLGGGLGYGIGWGVWDVLASHFYALIPGFTPEGFAQVQGLFERFGFWTIFAAGFTPIPYKLFTIAAGVFHISLPIFLFASLVSRGLRFLLLAGLIWRYGAPIRTFIERYFNLLTYLTLLLLLIAALLWRGLS